MDFGFDVFFEIPSGLDQSITIAVLVGLVVMLFFAEAFGWVFVGVVVPGYLASVLLIQPAAGIAVVVDSILTYLLARSLARMLELTDASSEFFGRERFFLIVLVSVLVRQHTHNYLMPWGIATFGLTDHLPHEFAHSLASLGLVLVPLMANVFWKLDLRRGLVQSAIAVAVTYAVLAYWLLPTTSLSYNSLELSYENTALDFLGNAKAYLIMLITAYLSAQLNLRYGWDFGGILIPALLALLWFTPSKLATTLLESLVLFLAIKVALKAPVLRTANLEGPRKTALVFCVGVTLKWIIGSVVGAGFPTVKVTDLYGFGYLLPTLLTLRMLKRKTVRGVLLPTLLASLLGLTVASLVGFLLELAYPNRPEERAPQFDTAQPALLESVPGFGVLAHARALDRRVVARSNRELAAWTKLWNVNASWLEQADVVRRASARRIAGRLELELHTLAHAQGRRIAYALVESEGDWSALRRWDAALLVPGAPGPVLEVPHPVREPLTAEVAMLLCPQLDCRAVIVAGQDDDDASARSFHIATNSLRPAASVEIRSDPSATRGRPRLELFGPLPDGVSLESLWPTPLELQWTHLAEAKSSPSMRLVVHPRDLEQRLALLAPQVPSEPSLLPWLRRRDHEVPFQARRPSLTELRALDRLVFEHAWRWSEQPDGDAHLPILSVYAHLLGMQVVHFKRCGDDSECLALVPANAHSPVAELVLLRRAPAPPLVIEVPRGGQVLGASQLALELWLERGARALVVSDLTTEDEDAQAFNPLLPGQTASSFQALHQALDLRLSTTSDEHPVILQINGYGSDRALETDVIIGAGRPSTEARAVPPGVMSLFSSHGALRFVDDVRVSDGTAELHALSGSGVPQFEYSLELGHARIAGLWFSPTLRERFTPRAHTSFQEQLERLGVPLLELDEVEALLASMEGGDTRPHARVRERLEQLERAAGAWARSHNIHDGMRLFALAGRAPNVSARAVLGLRTRRPMLLLEANDEGVLLRTLVFFDELGEDDVVIATTGTVRSGDVARALLARPRSLRLQGNGGASP